MNRIGLMFEPETVAVLGASNALEKWGAVIFSRVLRAPAVKRLYPANKTAAEVQGVKACSSVRDLPERAARVLAHLVSYGRYVRGGSHRAKGGFLSGPGPGGT